uniref:Photosystem I reaction center subunit IX n=1 Tax=Pseudobryopsis hainanensis TaxID=2320808 RepID=A0A3S5X212_9CHLO|nr:photosystem I reaction center subunit IX [Pseudobryopsis hainanensis]
MKNFATYLSTAPVIALIWLSLLSSALIEVNRFFPDPLIVAF